MYSRSVYINDGEKIHPTAKPIGLYDFLLHHYAKEGDTILDPFVGSGSSRIAAHKAGLDFEGWELDPDYHAAQEARYRAFVMNTAPASIEPVAANGQLKCF
jgi:DNA modification methylase